MSSPTPRAGFQRLYLVDHDLAPGLITVLPLTGNTLFVGRNGVGKTSRMALIAFFLGAEPGEVVARSKEKRFDEFHLPRTTSYLAMDYFNADGQPRCVMVYMAAQQLAYRLIQAHFQRSWVTHNGRFVEASDLTHRLLASDVAFYRSQITTIREYRSIIQGVPDGRGGPDYRMLRATYSLGGVRHSLPKIDKIISGMLHKMVDLRGLQSIILASIESEDQTSGGDPQALMGQLQGIDELVQQGEALEATEQAAPEFVAAENAYKSGRTALVTLGRLKSSITLSLPQMEALLEKLGLEVEEENRKLSDLALDYGRRKGELEGSIKTKAEEIRTAGKRKTALESESLLWAERHPEEMESRAANEDSYRQRHITAEDLLTALTSAHADITSEFNRLREAIQKQYRETLETAQAKKQAAKDALVQERDQARQDHIAQLESIRETHTERRNALAQEVFQLQTNLAVLEDRQIQPDEEMRAQRERVDTAVDSERAILDHEREALAKAQAAVDDVRKQGETEQKKKDACIAAIAALDDEINALREQIEASHATLVGYLRSEVADWEHSIGKVLDPDLLKRTDLSPHFEPSRDASVYGLHLDLEQVLPPEDTDTLKERLKARESTRDDRLREKTTIQKSLDALGRNATNAMAAKDQAESRYDSAQSRLTSYKNEREQLIAKQRAEMEKRKAAHEEAKKVAREALKAHRLAQQNFEADAKTELEEAQDLHKTHLDGIQARITAAEETYNATKRTAGDVQQRALTDCDKDLQAKLAEDDLGARITALTKERDWLAGQLRCIRDETSALQKWREFSRIYPVDIEEINQTLEKLRYQADAVKELLTNTLEQEQRETAAQKRVCKDKSTRHASLDAGVHRLKILEKHQLATIEFSPEGAQISLDPDYLHNEVMDAGRQRADAELALKQAFRALRTAFTKRPGSEVTKGWRAEEVARGSEEYDAMRDYLTAWYRYALRHAQQTYMQQLEVLKLAIDNFAASRERFHKSIARFSSSLRKSLEGVQISNAIEKLDLKISLDTRDDSYMPKALERLQGMTINARVLAEEPDTRERFVRDMRQLRNRLLESNALNAKPEQMINITGQVTENGNVRRIDKTTKIDDISSAGLSVLVQSTILMAFIDQVRGGATVDFPWALDELGTIDDNNIILLARALNERNIHLITAQPNITASTAVFKSFKWAAKPTPSGNIQAVEITA